MIAFFRKRENMETKVRANILERELFHGTDPSDVDKICKQNFDWRICGKNASVYGAGSYFAVNASYSNKYARRNVSGSRYSMFLAKVLVGSYVRGDKSYRRPPPKNPSNPTSDLYDSCVNNKLKPEIFVVFDIDQCYPSYVIEYEDVGCYGVALSQRSPAASGASTGIGYSRSSGYQQLRRSAPSTRPGSGLSTSYGASSPTSSGGSVASTGAGSSSFGYRSQAAAYRGSAYSASVKTSSSASSGSNYQHTSSSARRSAPLTHQASGSATSFGASSSTSSGSHYQHTSSSTPSPPIHPTEPPARKGSSCVIL